MLDCFPRAAIALAPTTQLLHRTAGMRPVITAFANLEILLLWAVVAVVIHRGFTVKSAGLSKPLFRCAALLGTAVLQFGVSRPFLYSR
ncbi:hypothetical protein HDK77DRAFT_454605 [Phyllosticta capitalensis]|uniref:uncharacterized protein n=1 Tax=Phyllosticta capitalensis TaxID=121624 RepID=UPI00312D3DAC